MMCPFSYKNARGLALAAGLAISSTQTMAQESVYWVGYQYTCSSPQNYPSSGSFFDGQNWLNFIPPGVAIMPGEEPDFDNLPDAVFGNDFQDAAGDGYPLTVKFGDFCYNPGVGCPGDQLIESPGAWVVRDIDIGNGGFVFDGASESANGGTCGNLSNTLGSIQSRRIDFNGPFDKTSLIFKDITVRTETIFADSVNSIVFEGNVSVTALFTRLLGTIDDVPVLRLSSPQHSLLTRELAAGAGSANRTGRIEVLGGAGIQTSPQGTTGFFSGLSLAPFDGSVGTMLVSGTSPNGIRSSLMVTDPILPSRVGSRGTGVLEVSEGAYAEFGGILTIGGEENANGELKILTGGEVVITDPLEIGFRGTGSVSVSGKGTSLTVLSFLRLGAIELGNGYLEVLDGAVVEAQSILGAVGGTIDEWNASAYLKITGDGSRVSTSQNIRFGGDNVQESTIEMSDGGSMHSGSSVTLVPPARLIGEGEISVGPTSTFDNASIVSPNDSDGTGPGMFNIINGNLLTTDDPTSVIELDVFLSTDASQGQLASDQIVCTSPARLGGTLRLRFDGTDVSAGETIDLFSASSLQGEFETIEQEGELPLGLIARTDYVDTDLDGTADTVRLKFVCLADVNDDNDVNSFDVTTFIGLFNDMNPRADFNSDGVLNFFDVTRFIAAYNSGC